MTENTITNNKRISKYESNNYNYGNKGNLPYRLIDYFLNII